MNIRRATPKDLTAAEMLVHEYYAAAHVQQHDSTDELMGYVTAAKAGFLIAVIDGTPAGCVALRPLPALLHAAECKRLYVRPQFRRHGLASALLQALEEHAMASGYRWVYLDSKDDLRDAVRLYTKRGYAFCDRYNSNPQATIFLRRELL